MNVVSAKLQTMRARQIHPIPMIKVAPLDEQPKMKPPDMSTDPQILFFPVPLAQNKQSAKFPRNKE